MSTNTFGLLIIKPYCKNSNENYLINTLELNEILNKKQNKCL